MMGLLWSGLLGAVGGALGVLLVLGMVSLYVKFKNAGRVPYQQYGRKAFIVTKDRPRLHGPFVWVHSNPNGAPVLLGEASWRTVSGCQLRVGRYTFWFQFRRFYKS